VWHYLRDPMFSHFHTIPECDWHMHTHTDRQTDRRTDTRRRHVPRSALRHVVKIYCIVSSCVKFLFTCVCPLFISNVGEFEVGGCFSYSCSGLLVSKTSQSFCCFRCHSWWNCKQQVSVVLQHLGFISCLVWIPQRWFPEALFTAFHSK